MGTNYYLHPKPWCETCERPFDALHIGKSSVGWVFGFEAHRDHDPKLVTTADWRAEIERVTAAGGHIEDEYGAVILTDEFWTMVAENKEWNGKPGRRWSDQSPPWWSRDRDRPWTDDEGNEFCPYEFS